MTVFYIVLVLFPLFGAAVFFWWRKKYGIWAAKRRADDAANTQVIDETAFSAGKKRP